MTPEELKIIQKIKRNIGMIDGLEKQIKRLHARNEALKKACKHGDVEMVDYGFHV